MIQRNRDFRDLETLLLRRAREQGAGVISGLKREYRSSEGQRILDVGNIRLKQRQLIEQAAAQSGTGDDDRTSERIATQSAELEKLLEQREALRKH